MLLSEKNIEKIKELIQDELTKRGFNACIIKLVETENGRIILETEEFQTVPAIFRKVGICNFATNVSVHPLSEINSMDNSGNTFVNVWIDIVVSYETFSGGTNCSNLFGVAFRVFDKTEFGVVLHKIF